MPSTSCVLETVVLSLAAIHAVSNLDPHSTGVHAVWEKEECVYLGSHTPWGGKRECGPATLMPPSSLEYTPLGRHPAGEMLAGLHLPE